MKKDSLFGALWSTSMSTWLTILSLPFLFRLINAKLSLVKHYLAKRLLMSLLFFLTASFLVFALMYSLPGSAASVLLGDEASSASVTELEARMGTGKPFLTSYLSFLFDFLRFRFPRSLVYDRPTLALIAESLGPTLILSTLAFLLVALVFLPLSAYLAAKRKGEKLSAIFVSLSFSLPSFLFALLIMLLFSLFLPILPVAGWADGWGGLKFSILPALVLALTYGGFIVELTGNEAREKRDKGFCLYARARGVGDASLSFRYIILSSLPTLLSPLAETCLSLVSGSAVVESIFGIPGLGSLLVSSVMKRDYPLSLSIVMLITFIGIILSLISDLLTYALNRRKGGAA
jgi:ABC-type dipeptide/oligopeptide/nickel transport systems, permease components